MDGVTTQKVVTIGVNKILSPKSFFFFLWATPHGAELHSTGQWVENLLRNGRQALVDHMVQGTLKVVESFKFVNEPSVCIKRR
jgi:guanylate kinase